MNHTIKWALRATRLYYPAQLVQWKLWERAGRPLPPPHIVKQRTIIDYATRFNLRVLVETGTFRGDMVEAMKERFDRVISIELSPHFFEAAKHRFRHYRTVEIVHGDSGKILADIVRKIGEPALYWLDGHHSGGLTARGETDTPVLQELACLLGVGTRSVILIDDARDFGREPTYPTLSQLRDFVFSRNSKLQFEVRDDLIRITPN